MSAANNARWIGAIQFTKIAIQLLSIVVLSRLLDPGDFGLMALAAAVSTFALLFRDFGIAPAIIQKSELDEATKSAAFWITTLLGLGIGLLVAVAAPLIAMWMEAPALRGMLWVLACTFPITGLSIVHQALLERASRFALVARIEIVASVIGFATAVISALNGAGAYSLVFQALAFAILMSSQLLVSASWRPSGFLSRSRVKGLWKFSRDMLAFNVVNYFARNADSLVIGKFLGPASLGAYSVAYRIMLFPLHNLTFIATRALFPIMSRRQSDVREIASMYAKTIGVIAFFTAPLMMGLFVLREPFVRAVFGPTWSQAADVIAWLAPIGFIQSIVSASGPVFMALGRTATMLRITLAASTLHVIGFLVGVRWSVEGVAACYLITNLIMAAPTLWVVSRCLQSHVRTILAAIRTPVLLSLTMGAALFAARSEVVRFDMPSLAQLAILAGVGGVAYLALSHFAAGALERDVFRALLKKA